MSDVAYFGIRHHGPGSAASLVQALQENVERGVGEGTALWIAWRVLSPWIVAAVGAWLLASWVCVYKRHGRPVARQTQMA